MRSIRSARAVAAGATVLALVCGPLTSGVASAAPAPPQFFSRTMIFGGTTGRDIIPKDLNGDGRTDLITTGESSVASIRLAGATKGTFSDPAAVALGGTSPRKVIPAQIGGSAALDLVVAFYPSSWAVVPGNGDGTFGIPNVTTLTGTSVRDVATGQLVGDGHADVVVGTHLGVTVVTGDGTNAPSGGTDLSTPGPVRAVEVADVTDDGRMDIVATTDDTTSVRPKLVIFPGSAGGGFDSRIDMTLPSPHTFSQLAIGDVTGDGINDVVVPTSGFSSETQLFVGQDGAPPAAGVDRRIGPRVPLVRIADVNQDGRNDLVAIGGYDASVMVQFSQPGGTFSPGFGWSVDSASGLAVADVTGSGLPDLLVASSNHISILTGLGGRQFSGVMTSPPPGQLSGSLPGVGDLDGDGRADVLVPWGTRMGVVLTTEHGHLTPPTMFNLGVATVDIEVCDVTGDGKSDAVATSGNSVLVAPGDGTGALGAPTLRPAGASPRELVTGDFTGDGRCDAAVVNTASGAVSVLAGAGADLAAPQAVAAGAAPGFLRGGDVDGDGDLDLVTLDAATPSRIIVLRNDGTGAFTLVPVALPAGAVLPTHNEGGQLEVADLDGDDRADIAVTVAISAVAHVLTYAGQATGAPLLDQDVPVSDDDDTYSHGTWALAAGDLNGDGAADLALSSNLYLLGNGDGTYETSRSGDFDRPNRIESIRDFDLDGATDFLGRAQYDVDFVLVRGSAVAEHPPYAPFASWGAFVDRVHTDLLGRPPTASERATAVAALDARTLTPGGFVAQLRASADQTASVDPAVRLYRAYFLRNPDPSGLRYWIKKRRAGATLSSISTSFAASSEFKNRYGKLSDADFVALVYRNVLGRPGEASGVAYWTKQLQTKRKNRGQVMLNFSESNEYKTKQRGPTEASVLFLLLLGRAPSASETAAVTATLTSGSVAEVAAWFLATEEYEDRITG